MFNRTPILTAAEKEVHRMYANNPMQLEIGLVRISGLTPYEIDMKVLDIRRKFETINEHELCTGRLQVNLTHGRIVSEEEYKKLMLAAHLKFNKITARDYDMSMLEFITAGPERELAALDVLLKHDDITKDEHDKETSTVLMKPWFKFQATLASDGEQMVMSMDYNQYFVEKLKTDGHPGDNEDEIIEFFIKDFGRKLHADSDDIPEEVMREEEMSFVVPDTLKDPE